MSQGKKLESISLEEDTGPILEQPMTLEAPEAHVEGLLGENVGILATKAMALEGFFRLLTMKMSFQEFMREILLIFTRSVRSEAGSILEMNYETDSIFFRAAVGHTSDKIVRFVIPMGQGVVGHVAESKQPLVVSDAEENRYHLKSIAKAVGFDVRNLIAIPLVIRGKVFGVIELLNRIGDETYTATDIELLTHLTQCASQAIEIRLMLASKRQNPESMEENPE